MTEVNDFLINDFNEILTYYWMYELNTVFLMSGNVNININKKINIF